MPGKLLVAVEFSDTGLAAIGAAIALAKDLKAGVVLVHIFHRDFMAPDLTPPGQGRVPDLEGRQEHQEALALATTWSDMARKAGLKVETETAMGDPATAIVEAGKRHDAVMIVVGTHGRTGLMRLVSGSIAEAVVRHADRPVLVVPHKA